MTHFQNVSLVLLRIATGWMMFYAGITKIIDLAWSAEGYLKAAKTFPDFFQWFLQPAVLPFTNFINEWGLTLLGVSLILGIMVRASSLLGAALMLLYYFPVLEFPYAGPHSYIVDEHVIYFCVLLVLASMRAGRIFGLDRWCAGLPICSRFSTLRNWLG